ncbi:MAG: hypothetical protein ACYC9I_06110 [Desulfuromonadales bacterium]
MVSALLRFIAIIIIALALCTQSGIVSAALVVSSAGDTCCPAEAAGPAEEGERCAEPECQCLSCLSIVLQEITVSLAGLTEPDLAYHETASALRGGVYRTIDYPPEVA